MQFGPQGRQSLGADIGQRQSLAGTGTMDTINNTPSIINSTGTCAAEWRQWWTMESRRCGSDWHSVLWLRREALRHLLRMVSS